MVAAQNPPSFEISIVDENIEKLDIDEEVDLVGITAFTYQAIRAYEIADEFRKRGVKVVMGGIHASCKPKEALEHADAVVVGEVEGVWEKVINDFKKGKLKGIYKAPKYPNLADLPPPRKDLIKKEAYLFKNTVQTTRGCPYTCDFCITPKLFGNTIRHRPVDLVVKEIEEMVRGKHGFDRLVYFLDDNTGLPPSYGKKLFEALIPLKIRWMGETSVRIAKDDQLLDLAAKSGCVCLMLGFESLSKKSLRSVAKSFLEPKIYEVAIKKIHKRGIAVFGFFIFGLDHDYEDVFIRTIKWAQKNCIDLGQFAPLVHFPQTKVYERDKDRLIHKKWWLRFGIGFDYTPKKMTRETLKEGTIWASRKYYSRLNLLGRLLRAPRTMFPLLPTALRIRKGIYYSSKYGRSRNLYPERGRI